MGLVANPQYWWTGIGILVLLALFLFASIPMMDKHMAAKRPQYAEYKKKVSAFFPLRGAFCDTENHGGDTELRSFSYRLYRKYGYTFMRQPLRKSARLRDTLMRQPNYLLPILYPINSIPGNRRLPVTEPSGSCSTSTRRRCVRRFPVTSLRQRFHTIQPCYPQFLQTLRGTRWAACGSTSRVRQ